MMAEHKKARRRTKKEAPRVGDSIHIGPIGPIPVVSENDPRRVDAIAAARIAQRATTCDELIELVLGHENAITRMEAVPRLKARFPEDAGALVALLSAVRDSDEGVRCAAISAVSDLNLPQAPELLFEALRDPEPDVRFFAAIGLQKLNDPRAPEDPEEFAYRSN
jgi:HEAT repeat protein